jgi:hypothetical protein
MQLSFCGLDSIVCCNKSLIHPRCLPLVQPIYVNHHRSFRVFIVDAMRTKFNESSARILIIHNQPGHKVIVRLLIAHNSPVTTFD